MKNIIKKSLPSANDEAVFLLALFLKLKKTLVYLMHNKEEVILYDCKAFNMRGANTENLKNISFPKVRVRLAL